MTTPPNLRCVFTAFMALLVLPFASRVTLAMDEVGRTPPVVAPTVRPLVDGDYDSYRKIRYITIIPGNIGIDHRIRLTVTSVRGECELGPYFPGCITDADCTLPGTCIHDDPKSIIDANAVGTVWYAQPLESDCVSSVTSTDPGDIAGGYDACPVVHLKGCPIVPTAEYAIEAVSGTDVSPALNYGTQLKPHVKWWGDCVGNFNGTFWTPPQGVSAIDDAVAAIKAWQFPGTVQAAHFTMVDVDPSQNGEWPQGVVGFNDVFGFILGFTGAGYPGNDLSQCP